MKLAIVYIRYFAKTATILGKAQRPADEVSEFKSIIYEEIDAALIIHVGIANFFHTMFLTSCR